MATKINTDYYGAENTWNSYTSLHASNVKYTANNKTIWNLKKDGVYTGGTLDMSASPWGIGESSLSSNFVGLNYRTADNRIRIIKNFSTKKNSPLLLFEGGSFHCASDWAGGETSPNSYLSQESVKQRLSPNLVCGDSFPTTISTLEIDENTSYQRMFALEGQTITSWDYQKSRLMVDVVWWRNKTTGAVSHDWLARFISDSSYRTATEDIEILGVTMFLGWQWGNPGDHPTGNESDSALIPTIDGIEIDTPEIYKQIYYGDDVTKYTPFYKKLLTLGYWRISSRWSTSSIDSSSSLGSYTDYGEPHATPYFGLTSLMFGNVSEKHQVFDDVSYHWEIRYTWNTSNNTGSNAITLQDGDIAPNTGYYLPYCALVIDEHSYDDIYQASYYALIHEACFMGLPVIANRYDYPYSIGDNDWVFLPKFDEHLVTTGEFTRGAATQNEQNYTWGNIFDDGMPEYDPDYQPPEPTPSDDDYGYLNNKATTNRVYSSNNRVYALTESQYNQFIKDINSLYLDDADGFEKFQLDFKGTNPTDYIVGTYGYTFLPAGLIPGQTAESIEIGAVTLPNAEGYRIAPAYIYNYKSLGQIDLTGAGLYKPFGDFRDFEPYTSIELYVPLCGNISLDPETVVGHTIQIEIRFDIMTGNATACVYRDNSTLIATIAGQLAATLPLSAGRMGDYQNAIKQAENALKQNELKTATAAATVAIGVGAALLAPETGGLSLAAYGAAVAGASSLMSLSNQKNEIEYEISHKQPSIAVCSAANGAVAQNISSMYAVCYIKQCKMMSTYNAETYAHTIGHACVINSTIGDQVTDSKNSFIKCGNVDLSGISATASETSAIQSLLTSGVYV